MVNPRTLRAAIRLLGPLLLVGGVANGQTLEPGRVTFEPSTPVSNSEVRVRYEAPEWLGAGAEVVLRARLRTPDDRAYGMGTDTRSMAVLKRHDDGLYHGTFMYPDSVAFTLFAISVRSGEQVDTNLRRGWPLLAHDHNGRPVQSAFCQQSNDLTGRDFREGLRAARRFTEAYPDDPASWYTLRFFERQTLGGEAADSAAAYWNSLVPRFDRMLSESTNPDPDLVSGLIWLATGVDSNIAEHWTDWLIKHVPAHPTSVQFQVYRALQKSSGDAPDLLAHLDRLYRNYGPVHHALVDYGFRTAVRAGTPEDALRWADRRARVQPWAGDEIATTLAAAPSTRGEGVRRLREQASRAADIPVDHRHLFATVDAHRAARKNRVARLKAALGAALLQEGDTAAALGPLEMAARSMWEPELLRNLALVRLAAGDSLGAARALARLVSDPAAENADSIRVHGRILAGADHWKKLSADAESQLREWILRDAQATTLPDEITLMNADGNPVELASVISAQAPTILVMYSRNCAYSVEATPRIQSLAENLAGHDVRLLIISQDRITEDTKTYFDEHGYTGPVLFDVNKEMTLALGSAGTPQYSTSYLMQRDRSGFATRR